MNRGGTRDGRRPEVPSGVALLSSPARRAIVDVLASRPYALEVDGSPSAGMTAGQLAQALDLHVTTVRFHLDQLEAAGLVRSELSRRFGVGRPRKVYTVAEGSLNPERHDRGLRILTALLAESFGAELTPAQAGERWAKGRVAVLEGGPARTAGEWLAKVGRMIDVLQDWGYTPNLTTSSGGRTCTIELDRCPFLELAESNPAVVCGIHRGVIRGVLEQLGERDLDVSLEPFVEPERCRARVSTRSPFRPSETPQESG